VAKKSKIEWTDATWNPWYGCQKISQGCKNCYMYRDMKRTPFDPDVVTRSKTKFNDPMKWKEPLKVFTCSWSDFFIEEADEWRAEALQIIAQTPHLTYQILTKRPERVLPWLDSACWPVSGCPIDTLPDNVWLGISAETQADYDKRIHHLLEVPASVHFLSCEPLLGMIHFGGAINNVDWVITGGESGFNCRLADPIWFQAIRDQCAANDVAYFHKQNGGNRKIDGIWGGNTFDGFSYQGFPFTKNRVV